MLLIEQEIDIIARESKGSCIEYFKQEVGKYLTAGQMPVRFAVTESTDKGYHCELGVLATEDNCPIGGQESIFKFNKRT